MMLNQTEKYDGSNLVNQLTISVWNNTCQQATNSHILSYSQKVQQTLLPIDRP
jgi:hypothetical protein